ncbi:hypothetical protein J9253_17810 [Thiothrix litoralis]|uniref:Uncharacterized protein n=2 Tax=Thiothrix litoralis TaxID=2891210 RepID=A0ABX7WTK6_9GAMM|nr:hypothetical protein J9253_17810 [Thiothrix litoralis]
MRETLRFSGKILSATISRTAEQWSGSPASRWTRKTITPSHPPKTKV